MSGFLERLAVQINRALGEMGEFITVSVMTEDAERVFAIGTTFCALGPIVYTASSVVDPQVVINGLILALADEKVVVWANSAHNEFIVQGGRQQIVVMKQDRCGYIFTARPLDPPVCALGRPFRVVGLGKYQFFHNETAEMLAAREKDFVA